MHPAIHQHIEALQADPNVLGSVLFGSWARGNNRPDSDIDLLVLVREGFQRAVEYRDGWGFAITYTTEHRAIAYWQSSPDDAVELWRIAKLRFARAGTMARLQRAGQAIQANGKPPLAPAPRAPTAFDLRDQLRARAALADTDPTTARMILATRGVQLTALYFDLRQRWTPPPKQRLAGLSRMDAAVHGLVVASFAEGSLMARSAPHERFSPQCLTDKA